MQKDPSAVEAWDKLPIRAILKNADKDLTTYFMHQSKYQCIVNDIQNLPDYERYRCPNAAVRTILQRLRESPFFDNTKYKIEYNTVLLSKDETGVKCSRLIELFDKKNVVTAFPQCSDKNNNVSYKDAMDALQFKLYL